MVRDHQQFRLVGRLIEAATEAASRKMRSETVDTKGCARSRTLVNPRKFASAGISARISAAETFGFALYSGVDARPRQCAFSNRSYQCWLSSPLALQWPGPTRRRARFIDRFGYLELADLNDNRGPKTVT